MAKQIKDFDYHVKAEELEQIVLELQKSDVDIDQATKLHAAGLKLVTELEQYLNQAEVTVKKHLASME